MNVPRKVRRGIDRRYDKAKKGGNVKRIKYDPEIKRADGQPITIVNPDVIVQREARDKALAEKQTQWQAPTIDCNFGQVIIWFMNNIPFGSEEDEAGKVKAPRKLTPEDAGNAYAVIKAFRDVPVIYVSLEDAVYTWLLDMVKTEGIAAFRPLATQAMVRERLEDLVKEGDSQPGKGEK